MAVYSTEPRPNNRNGYKAGFHCELMEDSCVLFDTIEPLKTNKHWNIFKYIKTSKVHLFVWEYTQDISSAIYTSSVD